MYEFNHEYLNALLYAGDFFFLASLATVIIKLKLEKSSLGFSAKTLGVYGVTIITCNIDLLFAEGTPLKIVYLVSKKIAKMSCIIYIIFKIKKFRHAKKSNSQCNCNQDSFWVEALVIPSILITAIYHSGGSPEDVLWSFSTYLETGAMLPQFYLIHVRGKGDTYLPTYISLMALYTLMDTLAYCLNCFIDDKMPPVWPGCKCLQLALYFWYVIIPREPVLPVANCGERKRKATVFIRQQSMLAQALLQKTTSSSDMQIFTVSSPSISYSDSGFASPGEESPSGSGQFYIGDSPPPSPCIKFDPAFQAETITIKAPRLNLKQLKGTIRINHSLPGTPESERKFGPKSNSSKGLGLNRSVSSGAFGLTLSETNNSNKTNRKFGVSLPTTPEPLRKIVSQKNLNRLIQQKTLSRNMKIKDISLPNSPELPRKNELVLKPNTNHCLYRSLTQLPSYYKEFTPTLPSVEGSLPNTPVNDKKSNLTLNNSFSSLKSEDSPILTPKVPRHKRPPLPKFILTTPNLENERF